MIVVDIGNTNIVIGIYNKKKLKKIIRFNTKDIKLIRKLNNFFNKKKLLKLKLDSKICTISSVSLFAQKEIIIFFKSLRFKILNVNIKTIPKDIKFNYVSGQLGADRIANTFAAINKYGKNILVIDFGTATTFDLITESHYRGGLIAPGINISLDALVDNASKLNKVPIIKTHKIIGNNTKVSIQSGFYWGYLSLINGIIKKMLMNNNIKTKIILTGGLAKIFQNEISFNTYYEPNLTLEGLYLIAQKKYA